MASKKHLTVYCTELAALAGRHQYRSKDDALEQFLFHNESVIFSDYEHLRDNVREARIRETTSRREEYQCRKRHAPMLENTLIKLAKADSPEEARLLLDEQLATVNDPTERETLKSVVFKTRGVQTETSTLDEYERVTGRSLKQRNTAFRTSELFTTPGGVEYRIGGRLDAVCDELGRVVEVKTRMNKFFLPDYDIVQVYGYFAITGLKTCDFIQTLCGELKTEIVEYEESTWNAIKSAMEQTLDGVLIVEPSVDECAEPDTAEDDDGFGSNGPMEDEGIYVEDPEALSVGV